MYLCSVYYIIYKYHLYCYTVRVLLHSHAPPQVSPFPCVSMSPVHISTPVFQKHSPINAPCSSEASHFISVVWRTGLWIEVFPVLATSISQQTEIVPSHEINKVTYNCWGLSPSLDQHVAPPILFHFSMTWKSRMGFQRTLRTEWNV